MKLLLPDPKRFIPHRYWIRGGVVGFLICLLLYPFYIFLFAASGGKLGSAVMWPAFATGHGITLLWGFVYPYGLFCPKSLHYSGWSLYPVQGGVACANFGSPNTGYCYDPFMYPSSRCAELSTEISFIIVLVLHLLIYFLIGAGIAILRKRLKDKLPPV